MAFCTKCGRQIPDGLKFCGFCGSPIWQASQPPTPGSTRGFEHTGPETVGRGSMSKATFGFAFIGGLVAFIPGASYLLIPMEVYLLYKIAMRYCDHLDVPSFVGAATALVAGSTFLKSLALFLNPIPVIGQIANSLVAFGFIVAFGLLAEHHYAKGPESQRRI